MKVKAFTLAGIAGSMLLTGVASAAYEGVSIETYVGDDWVANGYAGLTTYRLYANFDGMGDDGVLSVFGVAGLPMTWASSNGLFHNAPGGLNRNTAPDDLRFLGIYENLWDTFVTIGKDLADGDATTLSPGFNAETNGLASDWSTENGGWFVTPDDPQSQAVDNRVLLAQISVAEGVDVSGTINLLLRDNNQIDQVLFSTVTPTPGALALLGLAGLAAGRRRR